MRAFYFGRRRGQFRPAIRTCPHNLVVCACNPPPIEPPALDPPRDPWAECAVTLAFRPQQYRTEGR